MPASAGRHSYGASFWIDPAGGTNYVQLAEVIDITAPKIKVTDSPFTNLQSPSAWKEFKPGLIDGDVITLKLTFTEAEYNTRIGELRTALMSWKIQGPKAGGEANVGPTLTGQGHINMLGGPDFPDDGRVEMELSIKVSGPITFTAGN